MKLTGWIAAFCLWSWLEPAPVMACQYNVRDVGFVDLDAETYHLYEFVGPRTSPDLVKSIRDRSVVLLRDSNVAFDIIQADQQTNHPALKYLSIGLSDSQVAAVLVSPDGQSLLLKAAQSAERFQESLDATLNEITTSPTRDEIVRAVTQSFAAVLLIEGENSVENDQARSAIAKAVDEIRAQSKLMPKAIAGPPAIIALSAAALVREKILLWSVGLGTTNQAAPRAAVIYGRARWIGPLMKGEEISERNLTGLLSIIGADCECGLDISWTQGTRLPVRWTDQLHAQLAKSLGFDPENPLVKVEVSRIVSRREIGRAAGLGNREATQESTPALAPQLSTGVVKPESGTQAARGHGSAATSLPIAENRTVLWKWVVVLAALAGAVLLVGLFIVLRAKQ